eukprot:8599515-Pyramimonas_sp.AAC.1
MGRSRRPRVHCGAPLTRFVAPQGAQPKASGRFRRTPQTVRGPTRGATEGFRCPTGGGAEDLGPISARPSHA